ncbi:unnamed protein product, partial [Mesorhabditis belari]|uniref:cyclin-dependent kinase n=1 Tax=Mesorhabditis belari TaxID=2138241 RepID=A0AAF3FHB4_9BILA
MPDFLTVPGPGLVATRKMSGSDSCLHQIDIPSEGLSKKAHKEWNFFPRKFDFHLLDILRKNYSFVRVLADIDKEQEISEGREREKNMVSNPLGRRVDASPRPYKRRTKSPFKLGADESTSISSIDEQNDCTNEPSTSVWSQVRKEGRNILDDIVEAFETPRGEEARLLEGTRLSALQLRKDIRRCYAAMHPFIQCAAALYDLLLWKNPLSTLLLMLVFFYSLYRGWLASLLIALIYLQFSLNYLKAKHKIDIGLNFLPRKDVPMPKFDLTGAQVIYEVAKIGQHLLGFAADFLEKLNALVTWKDFKVSRVFFGLLIYWLFWSLLFNTGTCIGWCVAALGIRIFFTTFLFEKFPRLRNRLDTFGYFYRNLPIKKKLKDERRDDFESITTSTTTRASSSQLRDSNRNLYTSDSRLNSQQKAVSTNEIDFDSKANSTLTHSTTSVFSSSTMNRPPLTQQKSVPILRLESESSKENDEESLENEDPMIDNVISLRSCVLHDKEKRFPKGITHGNLYLTDRAIIFKQRGKDEELLLVMLEDLRIVKKISSLNTLTLMAKTRKSIEIEADGRRKPLQFIGVGNRDEFVKRLENASRKHERQHIERQRSDRRDRSPQRAHEWFGKDGISPRRVAKRSRERSNLPMSPRMKKEARQISASPSLNVDTPVFNDEKENLLLKEDDNDLPNNSISSPCSSDSSEAFVKTQMAHAKIHQIATPTAANLRTPKIDVLSPKEKSPSTPISELIEVASQVTEDSKAKSSEQPKCETAQKPVPFRIPKKTQQRENEIGSGSYGKVFKGRHRDTGREVAIKNLSLEGEKQGFPLSAIREIKTLRLLNHPNVVQLLDVVTDSNQNIRNPESEIFLVFEYVEHDLKGLLESHYLQLNFTQAAALFRQLLEGLLYCHEHKVVHRDLKPSNILLSNRGTLKLADFGLARQIDPENTRPYTKQVVTLWYRSPELLLGEENYGPSIDIWSAGCILFEFFSHKPLFRGDSEKVQLDEISKVCGSMISRVWPGVTLLPSYNMVPKQHFERRLRANIQKWMRLPEAAADLIDKMLTLDPSKRLTCREALDHRFIAGINYRRLEPLVLPADHECNELWLKNARKEGS